MRGKELKLGSCILGDKPHIVVAVDRQLEAVKISALGARGASIIEMRVDCFDQDIEKTVDYIHRVREWSGLPIIGTIRENIRTKANRLALFQKILPSVDAIDIEIDADINKEVIEAAETKTVIVSEHDFQKTPDDATLHQIVDQAVEQGADIVKIAVTARSRDDVTRLLRFTQDTETPIVTMAMGEQGAISRVTAPLFGSLLTYSFAVESVAPGQIPLDEVAAFMRRFYPGS